MSRPLTGLDVGNLARNGLMVPLCNGHADVGVGLSDIVIPAAGIGESKVSMDLCQVVIPNEGVGDAEIPLDRCGVVISVEGKRTAAVPLDYGGVVVSIDRLSAATMKFLIHPSDSAIASPCQHSSLENS